MRALAAAVASGKLPRLSGISLGFNHAKPSVVLLTLSNVRLRRQLDEVSAARNWLHEELDVMMRADGGAANGAGADPTVR